jgi:hypothetical protein
MRLRWRAVFELERPRIEQTRQEIQAAAQVRLPMRSYRQAVEWIESWQAHLERGELPPIREPRPPIVAYVNLENGVLAHVLGPLESPLRPLAECAEWIEQAYGVPNRTTVGYVLTGRLMFVRGAWKIEQNPMEQRGEFRVRVTFYSPDLNQQDMNNILGMVRKTWGAKHNKVIGSAEEELVAAIREGGGIPLEHGAKGQFWETVADRIDASSGSAALMRARRLQSKLRQEISGQLW